MPEVHAHAPLVPVQRDEVQAHAALAATAVAAHVHVRRPVTAAVVAGHRSLDFDHVRAHVGQHHRAVGARGHPAHVHHPNSVQRSGAVARRSGQRPSSRRGHEDGHCRSVARPAKHFRAVAAANDPTPGHDGYDPCDIIIIVVVVFVVVVVVVFVVVVVVVGVVDFVVFVVVVVVVDVVGFKDVSLHRVPSAVCVYIVFVS